MARPTKLTSAVIERICTALRVGATYELAAGYGGIAYNTFNEWRKRGAAELTRREQPGVKPDTVLWRREQPFVEFYEAIQKAEAEAAIGWLEKIEKAAREGNWQAAAWKLERRYPRDYGRVVQEHVGPDGGTLVVELKWHEGTIGDSSDAGD